MGRYPTHLSIAHGCCDWQMEVLNCKQGENETVRDYADEKIRLWKRVNPRISELILVTHVKLGFKMSLRQMLYSRFGKE